MVQVNISANADAVKSALKDIEAAIAKAGQTGRQFAQLDLSHPELANMATDIQRLSARFEDLGRVGRGATANAYRSIQGAMQGPAPNMGDPLAWQFGLNRVLMPGQVQQHMGQVGGYVVQGTRWAPQGPPGPQAPGMWQQFWGGGAAPTAAGAATGGAAGAGGGMFGAGSVLGGLKGGIGFGLGLAGISTVKQVLTESLGKAQEQATGTEDLYRHTDTTKSFLDLRDAVMESTKALGLNAIEAGRLSLTWAKITGQTDPNAITANVRTGAGFGRAFGMDPTIATMGMAQASNAGIDPRTFAVMVGDAAAKGGRSADETMSSMITIAQTTAKTFASNLGEQISMSGGMLAGLNATGLPGMRNGGSEAIMSTLNNSITQGGLAGVASAALSYRVGARQGVTDPWDLGMLQAGGLFASPKSMLGGRYTSTETNFAARMAEIEQEYKGQNPNRMYNAMSNDLGLTPPQARLLVEKYTPQDITKTVAALSPEQLQNMNPSGFLDAVRIANAKPEDLEKERQAMLGRHGQGELSPADQKALSDAGPDSLRSALLKLSAQYGQSETEGTKVREANTSLANAMTKVGQDMLPAFLDLKDGLGKLGGELGDLGSVITNVYRAGKGDKAAQQALMYSKEEIAAGGGETPLSDAASQEREAQIMAYAKSKGLDTEHAAALTSNVMAESGGLAHGPAGDGGRSIGLFQMDATHQEAIKKKFNKDIRDMTWQEQVDAMLWYISPQGPEAENGRDFYAAKSALGAGRVFTKQIERPANADTKGWIRGGFAETLARPDLIPQPFDASQPFNGVPAFSIDPLKIFHMDGSGNVLGTQTLPVTQINPPAPSGSQPKGQKPPAPPPPPAPSAPLIIAPGL